MVIDPSDIKKVYAAMSDAELLQFAKNESSGLTAEAFQILKSECSLRNIGADIIGGLEDGSYFEAQASLKKITKKVPDQLSTSILAFAINEKRDGKSNDTIVYHLMEQGIEEDESWQVITLLKPEAISRIKKANTAMLTAVFTLCAGFALKLISPQKTFITFLDIASTCAVVFGVLRFITGYINYKKYRTVIKNLDNTDNHSHRPQI